MASARPRRVVTRFAAASRRLGYPPAVSDREQVTTRTAQGRARDEAEIRGIVGGGPRWGGPVVASLLALAVSLPTHAAAPEPATAAPTAAKAEGKAAAAPSAADMEEVKRVYGEGKAKYATKDYDGAIADWTRALALLPETDENLEVRNDLVYNIATAQEKAYEIDRDVTRLRKAKALLEDFLANYQLLYKPDERTIEEFKRVRERIATLDTRISEAEKHAPPPVVVGVENAEKKRRDAAMNEILRTDPVLSKQYKSGRGMIIGGSIALATGGVFLLGALAFAGNSGPGERALPIALAGVGVAGVVAGSVLLGFGVPRRKHAKQEAASRVVFAPTLVPRRAGAAGYAGLGVLARF